MPIAAVLIAALIDLYSFAILVYVLGSWFPQWRYQDWYRTVGNAVEPFIGIFRGLKLQTGMLDLTPMAAMLFLTVFRMAVVAAFSGGMLH